MERIASSSRIFDPELRTSSIEFTAPLRAITKSRVSSPWIPATAASYGIAHTSSIFRLIDAKYEMYWTSGAFSGVSRNPPPPSSVTPSSPVAFSPVPTAFPAAAPCRGLPTALRVPSPSCRGKALGPAATSTGRFPARRFSRGAPRRRGEGVGSSFASRPPAGSAFRASTGNDSSGGRSCLTGRSGTRPCIAGEPGPPSSPAGRRGARPPTLEDAALRRLEVRRARNVREVDLHDFLRAADRGGKPVPQPEDEDVHQHGEAHADEEPAARWHNVQL